MRLDNMILTDFASAVASPINSNSEQTTRGTITFVDPDNDKNVEVLIDGTHGGNSTAATTMVKCEVDDRVMVLIKNHKATVIGNISSPVLKKVTANDIEAGAVTADTISGTWFYNKEKTSWINLKEGKLNFDNKLIWDGTNLSINGTIEADIGKIGGWSILKTQIHKSAITGGYEYRPFLHAPDSPSGGTTAFGVAVRTNDGHGSTGNWSYPFTVSYDGSLKAAKADITGNITATGGKIAGFDIDGDNLKNGNYVLLEAYNSSYGSGRLRLGPETGAHSALSGGGLVVYAANGSGSFVYSSGISTPSLSTIGGEISEAGTLLKNKYARLGAANTFNADQTVNGVLTADGGRGCLKFNDLNDGVGEVPIANSTSAANHIARMSMSSANTLNVNGRFGGNSWTTLHFTLTSTGSDIKLKKNVKQTEQKGLDLINSIGLYQFDWKETDQHQKIGFIANELETLDSNLIFEGDFKAVNSFYLQGYEVKAIQELSAKVDELERRINERGN